MAGVKEDFDTDNGGFSVQRPSDGTNVFNNNSTPTPGTTNVCFTRGTIFSTANGEVSIERLQSGDRLMPQGNGLQPIQWIWTRKQPCDKILQNPNLSAIKKGALGKTEQVG